MDRPILKVTVDDNGDYGYDIPGDTVSAMRKKE